MLMIISPFPKRFRFWKNNLPHSMEGYVVCALKPGLGFINGLPIDLEPLSHLSESLLKNRNDNSVSCGSHIDQDVASITTVKSGVVHK